MDPLTSSFTTGAAATIKLVEVTYQIRATDTQTADILNTSVHVNHNLTLTRAQLDEKSTWLPDSERKWILRVMNDTRQALESVARLIEPARVDKSVNGSIGWGSKAFWAFKYNPQVKDKHSVLQICHQTLMTALTRLLSIEPPIAAETSIPFVPPPPPYDAQMERLWQYHARRKQRKASALALERASELPSEDVSTPTHELHSISAFELDSTPSQSRAGDEISHAHSPPVTHRSSSVSAASHVSDLPNQSSGAARYTFELSTSPSVARHRPARPSISSMASSSERSHSLDSRLRDTRPSGTLGPEGQNAESSNPTTLPPLTFDRSLLALRHEELSAPRRQDHDQRMSWVSDEESVDRLRVGSPWDSAVTLSSVAGRSEEDGVAGTRPHEGRTLHDTGDGTVPRLNSRRGVRGSWMEYQRSLSTRERREPQQVDEGWIRSQPPVP